MMKTIAFAVLGLSLLFASGCNSQGGDVAPVVATVTYNGSPVTEGVISYMPAQGGKPGSGTINKDGTVTFTTFSEGDGLTKGSGDISFAAPSVEIPETLRPGQPLPKHELSGLTPKDKTITVGDSETTLTIELVKP